MNFDDTGNIFVIEGDWTAGPNPLRNAESFDQLDIPIIKHSVGPQISIYEDVRVITNESGVYAPQVNKEEILLEEMLQELQKANKKPQREVIYVKEEPRKTVVTSDSSIQTEAGPSKKLMVKNEYTISKSSLAKEGIVSEKSLIPRSISTSSMF